jgi:hypothetical protein
MSRLPAAFLLPALTCACQRVVERRAYAEDGQLAWSAVMPASRNTALWLEYLVSAPAARTSAEGAATPAYELYGSLQVHGGNRTWYSGGVILKPGGPALDRSSYDADRDDVVQECGYSTCTEMGFIKLLQLHEVPAGTLLDITSKLETTRGETSLGRAALLLAPN